MGISSGCTLRCLRPVTSLGSRNPPKWVSWISLKMLMMFWHGLPRIHPLPRSHTSAVWLLSFCASNYYSFAACFNYSAATLALATFHLSSSLFASWQRVLQVIRRWCFRGCVSMWMHLQWTEVACKGLEDWIGGSLRVRVSICWLFELCVKLDLLTVIVVVSA